MLKKALIVMAKKPVAGQTKTRLTPNFSEKEAADLYRCFLIDTLEQVRSIPGVQPYIAFTPVDDATHLFFEDFAPEFGLIPQIGNTLGERLDYVLSSCHALGHEQVAAMNSDSPSLPAEYLLFAFDMLDDFSIDVVLGPCEDGGYYLIGWKRPFPRLVHEVQMSTSYVLRDTLEIAEEEGLSAALLPPWYDVDELPDLIRLYEDLENSGKTSRTWDYLSGRRKELLPENSAQEKLPFSR